MLKWMNVNLKLSQLLVVSHKDHLGLLIFILYVDDLQKRVKVCKSFVYADDLKLVTTQPADIQSDLEAIEKEMIMKGNATFYQ